MLFKNNRQIIFCNPGGPFRFKLRGYGKQQFPSVFFSPSPYSTSHFSRNEITQLPLLVYCNFWSPLSHIFSFEANRRPPHPAKYRRILFWSRPPTRRSPYFAASSRKCLRFNTLILVGAKQRLLDKKESLDTLNSFSSCNVSGCHIKACHGFLQTRGGCSKLHNAVG